ncbi:Crp/Fnr family transcriptional regulator [Flavobacterium sp. 14A]|uniref:Crp/Fnr family transcriptional regulator n=1 Tax=Flavobacterium sp. 14A TaxID=2735896 RepID=UPI00156D9D18|nr:Crp/Fnr family transcriptional regulator [Flavobacterium sp. 14A]NRT11803.1 CRP-like cAMP-binding protein [Flavobacterium sp. 14A]
MNTNLLLKNIAKHITLNKEEEKLFISMITVQNCKSKTILLHAAETCKHSYFVNSGILRSFTINDNIVEHVLNFACEGYWIGDMYSLLSQKPGNLFIEVIEDAELLLLSKENQEQLYEKVPKFERFFRILTENSLVANQQRLMDNLSLSAEERFEKFCSKFPQLINKIPQKQIASYIGVTPEFFSKMKSKMLHR